MVTLHTKKKHNKKAERNEYRSLFQEKLNLFYHSYVEEVIIDVKILFYKIQILENSLCKNT